MWSKSQHERAAPWSAAACCRPRKPACWRAGRWARSVARGLRSRDGGSAKQAEETHTPAGWLLKAAAGCRTPRRFALVLSFLLLMCQAMTHGQQADTFSKVVSYRFDEVLTGSAAEGGVQSRVVSYRFDEVITGDTAQGGVQSPVVSYVYHDWLGDDHVAFQTSAVVSYAFASLAAPTGIAPGKKALPGPTLTTLTPVFSWKAISGVDGYGLTVTELTTGTIVYQNLGLGAVASFTLPAGALYPGYHYAWCVRASRSGEWSADSEALYFGLPETVPVAVAPTLVSPGTLLMPGPVVTDLRPTFVWKSVANAVAHELSVTDVISSASVFSKSNLERGTSYTPETSILQSGHAYRWRVRASNGQSWGAWSQAWHFQTASATKPPTAPVIVSPGTAKAAGPVLDAAAVIPFAWKAVKGATAQSLLIADADSGAVLHEHAVAGDAVGYALPAATLPPGARCWWNLRVQTAQGLSDFSTRRFFQTKAVYPAPVIASLLPTGLPASASTQTMELTGTGFRSGAQVLASYAGKTDVVLSASAVTLNSDHKLKLKLVPGTKSDTWTLKVRNTDGLISNDATFAVTMPGGTLLAPTVSQPSAVFVQPVLLTLSHANAVSTEIHYTLDGSTPTRLSPLYTVPLLFGAKTVTIKALCTSATMNNSPVLTQSYVFNLPIVKVPGESPAVMLAAGTSTYFKMVVPADVASFSVKSVATYPVVSPGFTLKMSMERLPVPTDYQWASVADFPLTENQTIQDVAGTPKTFFVLAQPDGNDPAYAKLTCTVVKTNEVTPPPTISPTAGKQYAPLTVTLGHPDWSAAIYYTLDGSDPDPFELTNSSTHTYVGPFIISTSTTVKARAFMLTKKQRMSPVVSRAFELLPNNPNFMIKTGSLSNPVEHAPSVQTWEMRIPLNWSSKEDVSFSYTIQIPPDQLPDTKQASMSITYPVAMVIEGLLLPNWVQVYMKPGATPATAADIDVFKLPTIDRSDLLSQSYVLGAVIGNQGKPLEPGTSYSVTVVVKGTQSVPQYKRSGVIPVVNLKFTLHQAEMLSFLTAGIQPNKDNTWLSIHGRIATADEPYIIDQTQALEGYFASPLGQAGQALRLNWGTMAETHGLDAGKVSTDESVYTAPVGIRTSEVLSKWGIKGPMLSLCGHSWGTHVAYALAKEQFQARGNQNIGKVARLIACDPAAYYRHEAPNFSAYSNHSWSFYAPQSYMYDGYAVGSAKLSATAQEAFIVPLIPEAGTNFSPSDDVINRHKATIQLFTHFLKTNYGINPPPLNQSVASYFTVSALDHQLDKTTPTPFRANQWDTSGSLSASQVVGGPFEGWIRGKINDDGLDTAEPLTLHYLQSGSTSPTPVVVPSAP